MVDPIPKDVKKVWEKWNIRGTILFSLSLQTILILLAPYRKCTRKKLLIMLIWSAYLLADAAANFTVGLISNSQGDDSDHKGSKDKEQLLAFWAPFLLLHLGGPDTITAFALEDNELWLRHLLGLGFQAVAALYVFAQSIPNKLWVPIVLMFVAGTIKYVERTRALYLASLDKFRDSMVREADPGPNYAKFMREYAFRRENKLPTKIIMIQETNKEVRATDIPVKKGKLNDWEIVHYAYQYFLIFKGLVVDLTFSFRERNESRKFFKEREADDALQVIEVELNFMYEVLYTKLQVLHSAWGYVFRFIAFGATVAALGLFHFRTKRHEFNNFDVGVTYTLLLGAVVLEVVALLMLIFSDWTFASIKDPYSNSGFRGKICRSFLRVRRPWWRRDSCAAKNLERDENFDILKHHVLATPIVFRRWSGSLASYNLISYCLKSSHTSRIHKFTRWPLVIAEKITSFLHINQCHHFLVKLIKAVWTAVIGFLSGVIYILSFIKGKIIDGINIVVDQPKRIPGLHHVIGKIGLLLSYAYTSIIGSMGLKDFIDELIYVSREPFTKELWEFIFKELKTKADHADDPEKAKRISVARGEWILTESDTRIDCSPLMQYVTDVAYDESLLLWHIATDLCYYTPVDKKVDKESFNYREFSKLLSDYMLYLLIMQPTMISVEGGIGNLRFRDTCAEAESFFDEEGLLSSRRKKNNRQKEIDACRAILSVNTDVKPVAVSGDRSKSVLFDASMLATELNELEKNGLEKWKLLSRMWVEFISYAATNCSAKTHAQQVGKGGELITFIWLLMAHFGLGKQFQINEGHARAKLIVGN